MKTNHQSLPQRRIIGASASAVAADALRESLAGIFVRALPYTEAAADAGLTREEYLSRKAQSARDTRDSRRARAAVEFAQAQVQAAPDAATADAVASFVRSALAHKGAERRTFVESAMSDPAHAALAPFIPGAFGEWARAIVRAHAHLATHPTRGVVCETRTLEGARAVRVFQTR